MVIDNAGFYSLQNYEIPDNIKLLRLPPYTPELNPSEKIWAFIIQYYKNNIFENMVQLKKWLSDFIVNNINPKIFKSITNHLIYMKYYKANFMV